MSDPRVCILVLNWNGAEDTLACLDSLAKVSYAQAQVVVIDNGSSDDSVARIRSAFPQIQIIELAENLFFGGGNNAGLAWAAENNFAYVIFLNNDTLVEADFLEPLVKAFADNPHVGMAGPLICYAADRELIWYAGGQVNLWTGVVAHRLIRREAVAAGVATLPTEYVTGCCLMMPTDLAMTLGGFDLAFTMYGEDVDLSLRCRALNRKLAFVPTSRIYHKVSASVGGEFGLHKLGRKARGLLRLYARHARWYQWPGILISQFVLSFKNLSIYLHHRSGRGEQH